MAKLSQRAVKPAVALSTAVTLVSAIFGCRPVNIDKSNKASSADCGASATSVGSTCIKDGFIYLLQEAVTGKLETSAGKSSISFGKLSLVKGDKLISNVRLTYPRGSAAAKTTTTFQIGTTTVGSPSTQFVGDSDTVSVIRQSMTHQVSDSADANVALSIAGSSAVPSNTESSLLVFRQTQVAYALDAKVQKPGMPPYFAADMLDTDKVKVTELKINSIADSIIEIDSKNIKSGDFLLVRSGTTWSIAEGKTSACEGASLAWTLNLDQKELSQDGAHTVSQARAVGSSAMQTVYKIPAGANPARLTLSAKLTVGTSADRNNCSLKITEPTTLSAVIFRPLNELPNEIQTARYLHEMGVVASEAAKLPTHPSGPPIQTILSLNWEHLRGDALLTETLVHVAAEDRLQSSKIFLQLSRAPDGLSSHLANMMLIDPDKPRALSIFDLAIEGDLATQTRFYLTGMGYNNDSKNISINDAKILFMHFRRIGDKL